jgi:hypothetical protein
MVPAGFDILEGGGAGPVIFALVLITDGTKTDRSSPRVDIDLDGTGGSRYRCCKAENCTKKHNPSQPLQETHKGY